MSYVRVQAGSYRDPSGLVAVLGDGSRALSCLVPALIAIRPLDWSAR